MSVASRDGSLAASLQAVHCRPDSCIAVLHHTPRIALVIRGPKKFPVKTAENKKIGFLPKDYTFFLADLAALIFTYARLDRGGAVKGSLERKVGFVFTHTWRGGTLRAWKAMGVSKYTIAVKNLLDQVSSSAKRRHDEAHAVTRTCAYPRVPAARTHACWKLWAWS